MCMAVHVGSSAVGATGGNGPNASAGDATPVFSESSKQSFTEPSTFPAPNELPVMRRLSHLPKDQKSHSKGGSYEGRRVGLGLRGPWHCCFLSTSESQCPMCGVNVLSVVVWVHPIRT